MSGWFIGTDGYPDNGAVTGDFYENYNLPYHARYKLSAHQNDGYPYLFRTASGWVYAYPYVKKNGAWRSADAKLRNGGWKECNVMRYDKVEAVYNLPTYEWEGDE